MPFKLGVIAGRRREEDRLLKEDWMLPRADTFGLCRCMTPLISDGSESHETNDFLVTRNIDAIRKSLNQKQQEQEKQTHKLEWLFEGPKPVSPRPTP